MLNSERLVVVGDIGGTHMRFAVADFEELRIDHYVQFRCSDFTSIQQGLAAYLKSIPNYPRRISLAVAGPLDNGRISMSNLPWSIGLDELRAMISTDDAVLLNDFAALALALPALANHDVHKIGGGDGIPNARMAVVGPGTGLGVAAVTSIGESWMAISGEGGHITFAPQTHEEYAVFEKLGFTRHHISCEHLLSGAGMTNVYSILREMVGMQGPARPLSPAEIVAAAHDGTDQEARQTLDYFGIWLGRFVGDIALVFGAQGGLYLAGGIPPKLQNELEHGDFRIAFENKGRLSSYLEKIPTYIIKAADAGLRGAAIAYLNQKKVEKRG
jgi:glucokinase